MDAKSIQRICTQSQAQVVDKGISLLLLAHIERIKCFFPSVSHQTSCYSDFRFTCSVCLINEYWSTFDILGSPTTTHLTKPPEEDVAPTCFHLSPLPS